MSAQGVLPAHRVSQLKTLELAQASEASDRRRNKLLGAVYRKVGIDERYSVFSPAAADGQIAFGDFFSPAAPGTKERMEVFERYAPELAHRSAEKALKAARTSSKDIGHLISVSCTGFAAPGFDIAVIKSLDLDPSVSRTQVGFMGCHGVFNALRVASALCGQESRRDALIVSVELCSLHYQRGQDPRQLLGNALFADGAGAAVVTARTSGWKMAAQGSFLVPDSEDAITWHVGNEGFEMDLSPKIKPLLKEHLPSWIDAWLRPQGLSIHDVKGWAVHPGGPGVLDAVQESLALSDKDLKVSRDTLRSFGNMSSATVLFILQEIMTKKDTLPCVSLGFGPGLAIEAALFT